VIVWLNGRLVDSSQAVVDVFDRGFLLADGIFETLLVVRGRPIWLREHIERLTAGAAALAILGAPGTYAAAAIVEALLVANGLLEEPRVAVRITHTRGPGPRGLAPPTTHSPTVLATAAPVGPPPKAVRTIIAASTRRNPYSITSRLKTLAFTDSIVALREALDRGADEAIMLNTAGNVACATAASVVVMKGDRVWTPPVEEGALPGIARARLLAAAARDGLDAAERTVRVEDLEAADAVVLTNSLRGAVPVAEIVGLRPAGSGDGGGLLVDLLRADIEDAARED
jgi:branched-chain amino acid aminotransferase